MDPAISLTLLASGTGLLAAGGGALAIRHRREVERLRRDMEARAERVLADARREADAIVREARILANEEIVKLREQVEQQQARRRLELDELEKRLSEREHLVNQQLNRVVDEDQRLRRRAEELRERQEALDHLAADQQRQQAQWTEALAKVAQMTPQEARERILQQARDDAQRDAVELSRKLLEEARLRSEDQARHVLATVIQRFAGAHTFESTTTSIAITSDEIKGRIIGREGRNIRAFEAVTGVTVLIDDTPNAVVISGFDPVRRAVAREAMARLIADGRIHPTRIEEVVTQVQQEVEESLLRYGEEAVARLNLAPLNVETSRLLGRLRFRHSFSQNILDHSIEVARLSGLLAAELGLDADAAKRAGLLHDIGKAVTHEVEGPHALVGAEMLRQHGEPDVVVNAVASHHQEVESDGPLGIVVSAADAISASRPGARSETMSTYLKRIEGLERIGHSFPGVEKCFAVQAGRELRVMVKPGQVDDSMAFDLARTICRKIEDELHYPGQIRVTVLREIRCVEFAK